MEVLRNLFTVEAIHNLFTMEAIHILITMETLVTWCFCSKLMNATSVVCPDFGIKSTQFFPPNFLIFIYKVTVKKSNILATFIKKIVVAKLLEIVQFGHTDSNLQLGPFLFFKSSI